MAYQRPQWEVDQVLRRDPQTFPRVLRACVVGGHAHLVRFDETDERELGFLGYYDRVSDHCYTWPNRPAGAVVDRDYTRLYLTDALLKYFEDLVGAGSTITKVAGYKNRVRSSSISFQSNGANYPRSAELLDRGVQLGDTVKVVATVNGEVYTRWTYVRGLIGEPVAATVDTTPEADPANGETQVADGSVIKLDGPDNCITVTADGTDYSGLESGYLDETYTIIVTQSSTGGDLTTARLRVISASGQDDQTDVVPAAGGMPTAIGTRGLKVTFDADAGASCSDSADDDDVPPDDLVEGQTWQVTVSDAYTEPSTAAGGTYTGSTAVNYLVTVTRGGVIGVAPYPQISVVTDRGTDISGPHDVVTSGAAIAIGTQGVTFTLTGSTLRKGDQWVVAVTPQTEGELKTIVLGHDLDDAIPGGAEVSLSLYIRVPEMEIPAGREGFAPVLNWEVNDAGTEICVSSGLIAYHPSWTDNGVPQPLDVYSESSQGWGRLYVQYRAWKQDLVGSLGYINDPADLDDAIDGDNVTDNPLKHGVHNALLNANGRDVAYLAVADPNDRTAWEEALDALVGREVYGLVPLTHDREVLNLFLAHVNAQSSAEQNFNRVLWTGLEGVPEKAILTAETSDDGEEVLATLEDDPETSGNQYTLLSIPAGNASLVKLGVRPRDIVRYLYTGDGFGNVTYTEFVVDEVINETSLRLVSGHISAVTTPQKIEIWRNLSATEEAEEIARMAGTWGSRRVRAVFPDKIETDGVEKDSVFLAAALAGLASGVRPHQSLTNYEIAGFTDIPRLRRFNDTQLDIMAASGVWIVQQLRNGQIVTRHAVTTGDTDDINEREEMITRNLDSITFRVRETVEPFKGRVNNVPGVRKRIQLELESLIEVLKTEDDHPDLGGQVLGLMEGTDITVRPHLVLRDRVVIDMFLDIPVALNGGRVQLVI